MARTSIDYKHGNNGGDLAAIEPPGPWYTKAHLVRLNFCILSLILFCEYTYDTTGSHA